jgi:hypothetical protein
MKTISELKKTFLSFFLQAVSDYFWNCWAVLRGLMLRPKALLVTPDGQRKALSFAGSRDDFYHRPLPGQAAYCPAKPPRNYASR